MQGIGLRSDQTVQLAETFGLLADPTRLSIVLRAARMLRAERRGKQVFYSMADACVHDVLKIMIDHLFIHEHGGSDEPHEGED